MDTIVLLSNVKTEKNTVSATALYLALKRSGYFIFYANIGVLGAQTIYFLKDFT